MYTSLWPIANMKRQRYWSTFVHQCSSVTVTFNEQRFHRKRSRYQYLKSVQIELLNLFHISQGTMSQTPARLDKVWSEMALIGHPLHVSLSSSREASLPFQKLAATFWFHSRLTLASIEGPYRAIAQEIFRDTFKFSHFCGQVYVTLNNMGKTILIYWRFIILSAS